MDATVTLFDETYEIDLVLDTYENGGRIAIRAYTEDGPFGTITTNVPEFPLKKGEIIVKTWNESEWVPQLLTQMPDMFKDTGKRVKLGYAEGQIWKLNTEGMEGYEPKT